MISSRLKMITLLLTRFLADYDEDVEIFEKLQNLDQGRTIELDELAKTLNVVITDKFDEVPDVTSEPPAAKVADWRGESRNLIQLFL